MITAKQPPVWFDIEPDRYPCKCHYCGKYGKTEDFAYIEMHDGFPDFLVHIKCIGEDFLTNSVKHGEVTKKRTVAKIWRSKQWPPKLKLAKKKEKIDFSIPEHMKPEKQSKHKPKKKH